MRIKLICCLAIAVLIVPACSQSLDCFQEDVFCVGLVLDTRGIDDLGVNQNTWLGLESSLADGVVDHIAYIESVNSKDYEKNISFFVDSGYDVIVTSGVGLRDATLRSADLYPDSVFVGMNQPGDDSAPNFIPVTFPEDRMGFLAGALAARLTRSGVVGAVCETSGIDTMWRYCEGFRAGATYTDDAVKVIVVYRDNESSDRLFIDSKWGFDTAQTLIENEADVIFAAGGETAVGALRAAAEADIKSIGAERDQAAALGGEGLGVITSVLGQTSFTVQRVMRMLREGNLPDTGMNPIGYVPFDAFVQKNVVQEMGSLLSGLESEDIQTSVPPEKP